MTSLPDTRPCLLALALAAAYPLHAYAVSAGVAQFAAGDVSLRGTDGSASPLVKGRDIESGQAIVTGASGRAQVRFSDGGLISLQPNTEFKIAAYADNAASPKDERFLVDLLRGSMRAITGLIGKRNRENYKVTTTTATIGIRGSGFNVGYNPDGSLGVTTELDAIEVCNAGGCVGLTAGESALIVNSTDAPQRSNVRAAVPTPDTAREVVVVGDKVNSEGKAAIITGETKVDASVSGSFNDLDFMARYATSSSVSRTTGNPAVLDAGKLTEVRDTSYIYRPVSVASAASLGSINNDDFIGWGRWSSATKEPLPSGSTIPLSNFHYMVGQPTMTMPMTGSVNYSMVGSTTPTNYMGSSGTLSAASLSADFGAGTVDASVTTSFGGTLNGSMYISGSGFSNGTFDGFFVGPNASRAGLAYTGYAGGGAYSGVVVFQAP